MCLTNEATTTSTTTTGSRSNPNAGAPRRRRRYVTVLVCNFDSKENVFFLTFENTKFKRRRIRETSVPLQRDGDGLFPV